MEGINTGKGPHAAEDLLELGAHDALEPGLLLGPLA